MPNNTSNYYVSPQLNFKLFEKCAFTVGRHHKGWFTHIATAKERIFFCCKWLALETLVAIVRVEFFVLNLILPDLPTCTHVLNKIETSSMLISQINLTRCNASAKVEYNVTSKKIEISRNCQWIKLAGTGRNLFGPV